MKLRALLALAAVGLFATTLAMPIHADTSEEAPPKKIWICHFPGHEMPDASDNFTIGAETVTGDYVTNPPPPSGPTAAQVAFCESRGGHLINLSEKGAVNGHDAALQARIALY